jgi:hypothetical protein
MPETFHAMAFKLSAEFSSKPPMPHDAEIPNEDGFAILRFANFRISAAGKGKILRTRPCQ